MNMWYIKAEEIGINRWEGYVCGPYGSHERPFEDGRSTTIGSMATTYNDAINEAKGYAIKNMGAIEDSIKILPYGHEMANIQSF